MSYILEAIKKADQERGIGSVPSLATPPEAERPPARSRRWFWIITALLSVNIVLVVILLTDRDAGVPATAAVAAPAPPERRPLPTDDRPAQPTPAADEVVAAEAAIPEKAAPRDNRPVLSTGGVVVLPGPANQQNPGTSPAPNEASDHRMGAETIAQDTSQLKSWYELPQSIRDSLALPRLDLHVYSEDPQKRFIMVNLKKYHEGEKLESGLVLEEILPDGMVMSYRGERFFVEK